MSLRLSSVHPGIVTDRKRLIQWLVFFLQLGTVVHEILHSMGMLHEQSRPDRDDYLTIDFDNIKSDKKDNFLKYGWNSVDTREIPYDLGSVMHYGSYVSQMTLYIHVW